MHKKISAQVVNHETWGRVAQVMNRYYFLIRYYWNYLQKPAKNIDTIKVLKAMLQSACSFTSNDQTITSL